FLMDWSETWPGAAPQLTLRFAAKTSQIRWKLVEILALLTASLIENGRESLFSDYLQIFLMDWSGTWPGAAPRLILSILALMMKIHWKVVEILALLAASLIENGRESLF